MTSKQSRQRVVIDTSVIVKWLNQQNEQRINQANELLRDMHQERVTAHSPELSKYEIGNTLLKSKGLTNRRGQRALVFVYSLPLQFVSETNTLAGLTYQLAYKYNLTYYDASFIALAHALDATLITDNIRHQGQAKSVKVIALKDY